LTDWVGISKGGSAQGSGDQAASGKDVNGAPGYEHVLNGTTDTSAAGPAWLSSSNYSADDRVTYNSAQYRAQRSISASAPPNWTASTVYNRGTIVKDTFDNQLYAPQVDDPNESKAPHDNPAQWALYTPATDTADWLSMQGESKTNSRISTVTTSA